MASLGLYTVTFLLILKLLLLILEAALTRQPSNSNNPAPTKRPSNSNDPARTGQPSNSNNPAPTEQRSNGDKSQYGREISLRLRAVAGVMSSFALVLGLVTFSRLSNLRPGIKEDCGNADADIVGEGVRIATWVQEFTLLLIALCGTFHYSPTAVQEVGAGLLITHVSLAIALLVPLVRQELSLIDAVLGSMVLDAQNIALSIQLTAKETLAARWQVYIVMFGQVMGLVTIAILVHTFRQDLLATKGCKCFSVFWWAWFSNCSTVSPNEVSTFWIYYGLRSIYFVQSTYRSLTSTFLFHLAKKQEEKNPCGYCQHCQDTAPELRSKKEEQPCGCKKRCDTCGNCHQCGHSDTCSGRHVEPCEGCGRCTKCKHKKLVEGDGLVGGLRYTQQPATISLLYLEHGVFALLSMFAVETTMTVHQIPPSSQVYAVGQITPIVIAGGTAIRAMWLSIKMFHKTVAD